MMSHLRQAARRGHGTIASRRLGLAAIACLLLSACTSGQPSRELGFAMPPRYLEAAPAPTNIGPHWWRAYRRPELARLVEKALADNLDIAAAIARIRQAEAQIISSRAALLPTLNGGASGSRARSGISGVESSAFSTSLSSTIVLDLFGRNRALLEGVQATAQASRVDKDYVALVASATVAITYFQMITAQDRVAIAERSAATAERVLRAIRARTAAGTTSNLEVAQQEALSAGLRAAIPGLRTQITTARNALAVLTGTVPQDFAAGGGSIAALALPVVRPGLPSDLLLRRPDVKEAEIKLAALDANIAAARAAFYPSISLTGQGGFQSNALAILLRPDSALYSLATSLTQPIFDPGTLRGNLELQRGLFDEALQVYRKTVLTALSDVSNALEATRRTAEQVRYQTQATMAARRAFSIVDGRLREGVVDIVTLLNTQTTLFNAEDALVQARYARAQASVALFQALGGGWTPETPLTAVTPAGEPALRPTP
jgi:NodT family efflux transporter outer membrane factor (OMF) lipoprotein